tara:strand:- start:2667 stop:2801 length:135 start_codon:yes stop_codon:yes gene_type:complete
MNRIKIKNVDIKKRFMHVPLYNIVIIYRKAAKDAKNKNACTANL